MRTYRILLGQMQLEVGSFLLRYSNFLRTKTSSFKATSCLRGIRLLQNQKTLRLISFVIVNVYEMRFHYSSLGSRTYVLCCIWSTRQTIKNAYTRCTKMRSKIVDYTNGQSQLNNTHTYRGRRLRSQGSASALIIKQQQFIINHKQKHTPLHLVLPCSCRLQFLNKQFKRIHLYTNKQQEI